VQVFERPVVRAASPPQAAAPQAQGQTTVRPQLQAAARTEPSLPTSPGTEEQGSPHYGPPRKSKELTFLDLGTGSPNAAEAKLANGVVEPLKADVPRPAAVAPKARASAPHQAEPPKPETKKLAPEPGEPGTELEFLIMDNGIESPARTSAGHKIIPEDLDLLFDAPTPEPAGKSQTSGRGIAVVGVPPKTPPTGRSGKVPAVRAETQGPGTPPPTPVPASLSPAAPVVPAAAPAKAAVTVPPLEVSELGGDLEIPGGSLREAAVAAAQPELMPASDPPRSFAPVLISGLAVLAVIAALLAWGLWNGGTQQAGMAPAVPAPAPMPMGAAPTSPARPAPTPTPVRPKPEALAKTDSAGPDEVIAAVRPSFKTDVALPTAGLSLETDSPANATAATVAPSELVKRLTAAERLAQQELAGRLNAAGFRSLLMPAKLATTDGVSAARSAWSMGTDAIRQYRGRIARLEQAYEDSVLTSQRAKRWSGAEMSAWISRQSLAESAESSQLADLMFSQVNEGLEILAALDGGYSIKGSAIGFKNAASATRYSSIRGWVDQRIAAWASMPRGAQPYSITAMLEALCEGFPAVE
jgi:hypothetical protein